MEGLSVVSKTFRALIYKAHRAVIFAIAQLSCFTISRHCTNESCSTPLFLEGRENMKILCRPTSRRRRRNEFLREYFFFFETQQRQRRLMAQVSYALDVKEARRRMLNVADGSVQCSERLQTAD